MHKVSIMDGPYDVGMHEVSFDGETPSIYSLSSVGSDDYVEWNRQFLVDFLSNQAIFPLYVSFIVYDDMLEEMVAQFREKGYEFTTELLEAKNYYWTDNKKIGYFPPCFRLVIPDVVTLDAVLRETYWLPAQNEFLSVSTVDNLRFIIREVPLGKHKTTKVADPTFRTDKPVTFITIEHDGQGFHLFSNEGKYATIEGLQQQLPENTVVCQVNDLFYEELW